MNSENSPIMESLSKEAAEKKAETRLFPSYRLLISLLSFCCFFLSAQSQGAMGAAIICMVTNETGNNTLETFHWDKTTQGWIHGARFLAYYLAQLPSGYLTSYLSSRTMTAVGLVALGTFDVMTVPCAIYSDALLITARVAQGMANVLVTTGSYGILGKWIPSHESSALLGFACLGLYSGSFPSFLLSSFVCKNAMLGWHYVFYISGGLSVLFSAVWCVFADNGPALSRWVSQEEKDYVMACKKHEVTSRKIPWKAMLSSGPIYGVVSGQIALEWLQYLSVTVAPAFFTDVLHLPLAQANLICAVPFIIATPVCTCFGHFLDKLRERGLLSTINIRRLAQIVANVVPAACCLALALQPVSEDVTGAVAAFTLGVVAFTCTTSGWIANVSDLAPLQGGATFALSQALANWVSFCVPVLVDYLTADKTKENWNDVFYITIGIQLVCFVGFCMLASGEVQPWAQFEEEHSSLCSNKAKRSHTPR